ncbi:MAG: elongation factor Ts [Alphaproteobacteria bacterium]|nr:elongation factor Ts [Alphaproteobacteria bacterium]
MAEITASKVKELREKTGAGMMDAKKALVENGGDMDAAVDWLRTKGLAKAAKKSGRTAADGLVAIAIDGTEGAVVEVNSETDFVARNEEFQNFVKSVAEKAQGVENAEELAGRELAAGKTVAESLTDLVAKIGENMTLRRAQSIKVSSGAVVGYVHGSLGDNIGKIGVLVALESDASADALQAVGKQLAMHIAAANPQFLSPDSVDPEVAEREKSVLIEQAKAEGKPQEIAEKMVQGRMQKFFKEICLTEQIFVIDGETKVADVIANAAKEAGSDIKLTGYIRVQLGEGIEKEEEDFAAEVAKAANG